MCLICCPLHVDSVDAIADGIDRARAAVAEGARLIEWRVDLLAEEAHAIALRSIEHLVRECPAACIVTIRPSWEGGLYGGSETDRISLLEALGTGTHAPTYVDIELDAYRTSRNRRQKVNLAVEHERQSREGMPRLILSTHDFRGRPADLTQRAAAMAGEPACAVMKLAWHARSIRDNLEAFDLVAERVKPTVALCMGEFGLLSRVLAPKFGAAFTFAALARGAESAPGQPTIRELRSRYRFDRIGRETKVFGVVGWPVAHSLSPAVHNAGFDAAGFDGVYLPLPVPAEWEHFKASVGSMIDHRRLTFRGASVTIPHKEHLVRFVRERGGHVGALASALGAANTLTVDEEGQVACSNTDAPAAVDVLAHALGEKGDALRSLEGVRVAILGAGGVARAVAGGVALAGGDAVVFARRPEQARRLADEVGRAVASLDPAALEASERSAAVSSVGKVVAGAAASLGCGCFHAFVNCTPVGMAGGSDPDGDPIDSISEGFADGIGYGGVVAFDTVYVPERTPWLQVAADRGARCVTGTAMFLRQAERQFRRWTGSLPATGLFERALAQRAG